MVLQRPLKLIFNTRRSKRAIDVEKNRKSEKGLCAEKKRGYGEEMKRQEEAAQSLEAAQPLNIIR